MLVPCRDEVPRALVTESAGAEESLPISNHGARARRITRTP